MNQAECANRDTSDPIVIIYRHAEGIERVTSLAGMPVLDLIARHEIPRLSVSKTPESPPNTPILSAVRRLSGATTLFPQAPEMLAQDFGLAYFPLDSVAINPEIGFLVLRTRPKRKADGRQGHSKTLLLWEVAEDSFHVMPLLTDTAEIAARMYGERPKASPTARLATIAPQR